MSTLHGLSAEAAVVIIDDAHWADRSSLRLLRQRLRSRQPDPITVLVTCRARELPADSFLHAVFGELRRGRALRRVPGDEPALRTMLQARLAVKLYVAGAPRRLAELTDANGELMTDRTCPDSTRSRHRDGGRLKLVSARSGLEQALKIFR